MNSQTFQQSPKADPRFFYGYIVVVTTFFMMVVIYGVYQSFGIFFKPVVAEFGWTRAITSGAFSLSWIMHGLLGIFMGRFNDRFGPRVVMTFCGFLLGLGYLLMSQLSAAWQLYLFFGVIIGIGMGGGWVTLLSTVARWFAKRRSMMTGIVITGMGIGNLIGPPVANWLISTYDWRMAYIILGSIVLVVVVLAAQLLRRDPAQMGQLPYGRSKEAELELELGAEGFSLKEAVCTKQFWFLAGLLFCLGFSLFAIVVHIAPHAIDLGISATSSANILAAIGGASIVGMVALGSAADRIGSRQTLIIGFSLMSLALLWLVPATDMWMFYLFVVVFGFANGGVTVSESPLVASLFGLRSHGLILGVIDLGFTIGAAMGPFVAGYIFDVTGGYQVAFLVSAAIGIVGIILSAVLRPFSGARVKI